MQVDTDSQPQRRNNLKTPRRSAVLGGEELAGNIYTGQAAARAKWLDRLNLMRAGNMMTGVYAAAIHQGDQTEGAVVYISQAQEIYRGLTCHSGKDHSVAGD